MRVTSAINDLRREIEQKENAKDGRIQQMQGALNELVSKYTELQTILTLDRLPAVGGFHSATGSTWNVNIWFLLPSEARQQWR